MRYWILYFKKRNSDEVVGIGGPYDSYSKAIEKAKDGLSHTVVKECYRQNVYGSPKTPTEVWNFDREEDYPDDIGG